jgi:hypothetical protein
MSEKVVHRAPVMGTCDRCGCALSYVAARRDGAWYCCGACAGSDRCTCGCRPSDTRVRSSDNYVPSRRMFASRRWDGLNDRDDGEDRARAFPFADPQRGR